MKSRTEEMKKDLQKPLIKKLFDKLVGGYLQHEEAERGYAPHLGTAAAVAADSALFNAPSKIKPVKKFIEQEKKDAPELSQMASIFGDLAGSTVAGGAAVKGLSKVGKLKKILEGAKAGNTIARTAAYGLGTEVPEKIFHNNPKHHIMDDVGDVVRAGLGGALFGGLGHAAGFFLKPVAKSLGIKNPARSGKQIRDEIGSELFHSLDKRTVNHAKNIIENPIESKHLNLNNLLHRGNEESLAKIDSLYQENPRVRQILKREMKNLSEGQMPHIRDSIIENGGLFSRPDVKTYVKNSKKKISDVTKNLYDKANEVGEIKNLPERLELDPRFKSAVDKAYKNIHPLDVKKPTYEKHSMRNLHVAKDYIHDDIEKFARSGDNRDKMFATEVYNDLKNTLNKNSKDYEKATGIYKKYFDIRDAAEKGLDFKNQNIDEIMRKLTTMGGREKHAYKTGAIQSLLEKAEARSQNSKLAELGKDFTNPEIKRKLENILGEEKINSIIKDIEASNEAVRNISGISQGSKTATHMSNKNLFRNTFGAAKGSVKGIINLIFGAGDKIKEDKSAREAALKMRLYLNPKRLLTYENIPEKAGSNIIPIMYGKKNTTENRTKKEEEAARAERRRNRPKRPTHAERVAAINAKYDKKRAEIRKKYSQYY
jgi:hypothetical protein